MKSISVTIDSVWTCMTSVMELMTVETTAMNRVAVSVITKYKCKNHFHEMKGDVGMSSHEKEKEQEDAHQDRKSFITPPLHLRFAQNCCFLCYT